MCKSYVLACFVQSHLELIFHNIPSDRFVVSAVLFIDGSSENLVTGATTSKSLSKQVPGIAGNFEVMTPRDSRDNLLAES
jgi:hypothetical protein